MGDAPGDRAGLAGPGAGEDAHGTPRRQHGTTLLRVETLEGRLRTIFPSATISPSAPHVTHAPIVASASDIASEASPRG
ncbi:hypothetical protein GCM10009832_20260 [Dietzia kunjamensis subsp. schimae]